MVSDDLPSTEQLLRGADLALPSGAMLMGVHTAPGKGILFGEHFVVYGVPALAVPIASVQTRVEVCAAGVERRLYAAVTGEALATAERVLAAALGAVGDELPANLAVVVSSTNPVGFGLGSSAAFSVALAAALAQAAGQALVPEELRERAHALEAIFHGTPSGIDSTVIALGRPIWFVRGQPALPLAPAAAVLDELIVARSATPGVTRDAVAAVRTLKDREPAAFASHCRAAQGLVTAGRDALIRGDRRALGELMDQNHALLQTVGVSTPPLDRLVAAARQAGAYGAKLTGAGWGGCVIALAAPVQRAAVSAALYAAGASQVLDPQPSADAIATPTSDEAPSS